MLAFMYVAGALLTVTLTVLFDSFDQGTGERT